MLVESILDLVALGYPRLFRREVLGRVSSVIKELALLKEIVVIGLGPGGWDHLTIGSWEALKEGRQIFLRTAKHPIVKELTERGIKFSTFDYLYEEKKTFPEVYRSIADILIQELDKETVLESVYYAVPGHPLVAEESVQLLLRECPALGIQITFVPAMGFLDSLITAIKFDPVEGLLVLDALKFEKEDLVPCRHTIFAQVYNRLVASDLKLSLLEVYPPEHPAVVVRRASITEEETVTCVPLAELDHLDWFDYLTSVYLEPITEVTIRKPCQYPLDPLVEVMEDLLSPQGCPWDREQDHFTLRPYLIEETYEVLEAIEKKDMHKLKEELGDLLLQIVFHTMLAQNRGDFTCQDVVEEISRKMIRRHPHVFGGLSVKHSAEVLKNWEQIKAAERGGDPQRGRILDQLNRSLPALLLAEEVQKKASKAGFDWKDAQGAWDKLLEEVHELKDALLGQNRKGRAAERQDVERQAAVEEELGDLLFAIVNVARFTKLSPEAALYKSIHKFINRFNYIEDVLLKKNKKWDEMDIHKLNILWEQAKNLKNNEKV